MSCNEFICKHKLEVTNSHYVQPGNWFYCCMCKATKDPDYTLEAGDIKSAHQIIRCIHCDQFYYKHILPYTEDYVILYITKTKE